MSIFGSNEAGSLGQVAPDTGRGDAFDGLARQRGWGQSPACAPPTRVGYLAHTHRPLAGLGQEYTRVQLHPPQPVPLYPGEEIEVQALQGLGAAPPGTFGRTRRTGVIRLSSTISVGVEAAILDMAGNVVASAFIPPRNRVDISVVPGRYTVRYTATFHQRGASRRDPGYRVRPGGRQVIKLSAY